MPHWRSGNLPPDADGGGSDNQEVKVVDMLTKVPPSQIVFLTYRDGTGGNYWRWTAEGWEPAVHGSTVPLNCRE